MDKNDEKFQWGDIDLPSLREFLTEKLGWEGQMADAYVNPILLRRQENLIQPTLGSFFQANRGALTGKQADDFVAPLPLGENTDPLTFATDRLRLAANRLRARKRGEPLAPGALAKAGRRRGRAQTKIGRKRKAADKGAEQPSSSETPVPAIDLTLPGAKKPSRGPTPYSRWLKANRALIRAEMPGEKAAEVNREAARRWKELPAEEKAKWTTEDLAAAASSAAGASSNTAQAKSADATTPPAKKVKERAIEDCDVYMRQLPVNEIPGNKVKRKKAVGTAWVGKMRE